MAYGVWRMACGRDCLGDSNRVVNNIDGITSTAWRGCVTITCVRGLLYFVVIIYGNASTVWRAGAVAMSTVRSAAAAVDVVGIY